MDALSIAVAAVQAFMERFDLEYWCQHDAEIIWKAFETRWYVEFHPWFMTLRDVAA